MENYDNDTILDFGTVRLEAGSHKCTSGATVNFLTGFVILLHLIIMVVIVLNQFFYERNFARLRQISRQRERLLKECLANDLAAAAAAAPVSTRARARRSLHRTDTHSPDTTTSGQSSGADLKNDECAIDAAVSDNSDEAAVEHHSEGN